MSGDTYFKLLKKSQILEHVVQLSSNVGKSEQQVQRLQCEQARAQCVQDRVFAELERYRRQVVDVQQQFLGLVEALTGLCMREEEVQETNGPEHHNVSVEEQTLLDLERVTSPTAKASGSTIETQALATVGRQRVQQLEAICARYERQLVGSEAALSQVIYSDAARESAAKITQLEARNQQHEADKQALQVQLELARGQVAHLQDQLARTQERRTTLEHVRHCRGSCCSCLDSGHLGTGKPTTGARVYQAFHCNTKGGWFLSAFLLAYLKRLVCSLHLTYKQSYADVMGSFPSHTSRLSQD